MAFRRVSGWTLLLLGAISACGSRTAPLLGEDSDERGAVGGSPSGSGGFFSPSGGSDGSGGAPAGSGGADGSGGAFDALVATAVSTGAFRTCALINDGSLRCWGSNEHGAAGHALGVCENMTLPCVEHCCIGDDEPASAAGTVDLGGKATSVSLGPKHSCAVLEGGAVRCWGDGARGALGYANSDRVGDVEPPSSAGDVEIGGSAVAVVVGGSAEAHSCALLSDGRVRCWGNGSTGALGYGNQFIIGDDEVPAVAGDVDVGGVVTQLAAGSAFTCALLVDGRVRCWGYGGHGRLGYGNTDSVGQRETPAKAGDVDVGGRVVQLAAGGRHTCAVLENGAVRCWGAGREGQLGYANLEHVGDDESPASMGDVDVGGPVAKIAAAKWRTCALLVTGEVKCWGPNSSSVLGLPGFTPLDARCALCINDRSDCCLGDDEPPAAVGAIDLGGRAIDIDVGQFHACAVLEQGTVRCWGSAQYGGLGYGAGQETVGDDESPAQVGDVPIF